jgi:transposase
MRATTLLNTLLGIKFTQVVNAEFTEDGLICDVEPTTEIPRCGGCYRRVRKVHERREARRWRHLDLAGMRLELRYRPRRVACARCGVTTELVPWAEPMSWFTHGFEQTVGYLAQMSAKTVVSEMMRISWSTVGAIVGRLVDRLLPGDRLDGLTHIGVDELSYRKHHKYVTIVVDHVSGRVVWAREGKNADTLRAFFHELGAERAARIETVTIDMSQAYITAVSECASNAQIIFDRFHVQRLVQDALDEVRRAEVRTIEEPGERGALKHTRFALLKNPWNLTALEHTKLTELPKTNATLYRAYLMKESFAAILDRRQPNVVRDKLVEWTSWAAHSGLKPFAKTARTIAKHLDGIVAYVSTGLSNAASEGTNGKVRTITRRSYGLHGAQALIAMIHLCCSGLRLRPAHSYPRIHQT